jgi:hypothetical protein
MGNGVLAGRYRRRFPGYSYSEGKSYRLFRLSACQMLTIGRSVRVPDQRAAYSTIYWPPGERDAMINFADFPAVPH